MMIVEFRVANFLSIRDEQTLSFVAGTNKKIEHSHHCLLTPEKKPQRLLKTLALYGPNAAGKSNVLMALRVMMRVIRDSNRLNTGEPIQDIKPYALSTKTRNEPSLFELTFLAEVDDETVRYQYGFVADQERIHEEWLYSYPKTNARTLLHRVLDEDLEWDGSLIKKKQWASVAERTNANCLFLSKAGGSENHPLLGPLYQWLQDHILFVGVINDQIERFSSKKLKQEAEFSDFLGQVLSNAGTGIMESRIDDVPLASVIPPDIPEEIKAEILKTDALTMKVKTIRQDEEGMPVVLDLEDESRGTQRLFALSGPIHEAFKRGALLVIDELEASMHPLLSRQLLALFHSEIESAQFAFTTHQTHLLDKRFLRRDQVWLVEKDEHGSTHLYSLWDLKVRDDLALEKAYLSGRFGATPVIEELVHGQA